MTDCNCRVHYSLAARNASTPQRSADLLRIGNRGDEERVSMGLFAGRPIFSATSPYIRKRRYFCARALCDS